MSHPNDTFCPSEKRLRIKVEISLYKMRADIKAYYKYQKSLSIRPTTRKKGQSIEERSKQLPGPPPISFLLFLTPTLTPSCLAFAHVVHNCWFPFGHSNTISPTPHLPSRSFTWGLPRELPVIFRAFMPQLDRKKNQPNSFTATSVFYPSLTWVLYTCNRLTYRTESGWDVGNYLIRPE